MAKKPTWEELKSEYATTDISYRLMAKKYGMSQSTVSKMARLHGWTEERANYRQNLVTKTVEKITEEKVNHLAGIARSADKMASTIERVMEDTDQFFRRIDSFGGEHVSAKADTKAIKELSAAMKDLTAVLRNVYNIPTEAESLSMQLARERLELEKKKADTVEDLAYGVSAGVVLIPPVMDEDDDE